ncbi:MAG: serine hydrolase [Longimicrobiales bacterium]
MRPQSDKTPARSHTWAVLLALFALSVSFPYSAHAQGSQSDPLEGFDDYARQAVADWGATGLAVAVVKDGELLFAEGYGVRTLGQPELVDTETLFSIGSTTKAMTAAAIGMLVDEGHMEWDDLVVDHLPGFQLSDPYLTREITVRDLLTHRAGLGNADFLWYEQEVDQAEVIHRIRYAEPAYSLRSSFIYQNIMYATAGAVVEAVSGVPWEAFVQTRIFEPLGMSHTVSTLAATRTKPNVATPHYRIEGEVHAIENASVDPVAAAGSVWSSVENMSRWLRLLLAEGVTPEGDVLLAPETIEEMFEAQTLVPRSQFYPTAQLTKPNWTTYGLGWFQHDYQGRKVDFHTGSIDGMVAIAGLIRDEELGVYVLGNLDHVEVRHALMYRVFDLFGAGEPRDWSTDLKTLYDGLAEQGEAARAEAAENRAQGTTPSRPLAAFTGTYHDRLYGTVEVSQRDGGLYLHYGPGLQGPLDHWHYDTFQIPWEARWRGRGTATFETGSDGVVAALLLGGSRFSRER